MSERKETCEQENPNKIQNLNLRLLSLQIKTQKLEKELFNLRNNEAEQKNPEQISKLEYQLDSMKKRIIFIEELIKCNDNPNKEDLIFRLENLGLRKQAKKYREKLERQKLKKEKQDKDENEKSKNQENEEGEENEKEDIGFRSNIIFETNEKTITVSSLGYKFQFENNDIGLNRAVDIVEKLDYLSKIGLSYFQNNFKDMMELIKQYLPNQGGNINIDEKNGNFLNIGEINIILEVFKNIGIIGTNQDLDPFQTYPLQYSEMWNRMEKIKEKDKEKYYFYDNGKEIFNKEKFKNLLQEKNKV